MTLEQAIDRYTNNAEYERIHGSLQGCIDFRQLAEWLKNYKRLLEQQPTTTTNNNEPITVIYPTIVCDDAISREAVLNLCTNDKYNIPFEYKDDKGIHRGYDEYRLINYYKLKQLPPVTQKSGKWIDIPFSHYYKCSECDKYQISATNYCPNCGAKMESEE